MYFDEHADYLKQYRKGIRMISFTTQKPKITKGLELEIEKRSKSYDLYFSKKGILVNSYIYYYFKNKIKEITRNTYSYSKDGKILSILSTDCETNILNEDRI